MRSIGKKHSEKRMVKEIESSESVNHYLIMTDVSRITPEFLVYVLKKTINC